jgi:hypothetical protein
LLSELARSGRKASGLAAARRRRISTASWAAARALAAAERAHKIAEIVERAGEIGKEGVGPGGGEAAVDVIRLMGCVEGLLAAAERAQTSAEIVERQRKNRLQLIAKIVAAFALGYAS